MAPRMMMGEKRFTTSVYGHPLPSRPESDNPAFTSGSYGDHMKPAVLFICVHNAGRSQMAAGLLRDLAGDKVDVFSAGSEPAESLNPVAVEAMAELDIDIAGETPRRWSDDMIRSVDVVVTMGCGDACPVFPGRRYLDWEIEDPAGKSLDQVRPIRDELASRVRGLISGLGVEASR